jgi:mannosyltransferase OCH1-like enzyme
MEKKEKVNLHLAGVAAVGTVVGAALASHALTMNNKIGKLVPPKELNSNSNSNSISNIPKIIHQIWIGTEPPPFEWINSWLEFCKQYNWQHILWDNKRVEEFLETLVNKKEYNSSHSYQQKSDILRYEIMLKYGGFYIDCDMIWLQRDIELYLNLENEFIGVQEPLSSAYGLIGSPYLANGFFACKPNCDILKQCVDSLSSRFTMSQKAWISTGPVLFNSCINTPIYIIPSTWVFPVSIKTLTTPDYHEFIGKSLIFTKAGTETPHTQDLKDLPKTFKKYIDRIFYV